MPQNAAIPANTRLLLLLNPGKTSRNYLVGISRAAQKLGILAGAIELDAIWKQLATNDAAALSAQQQAARQMAAMCKQERITHVLSYAPNGVFEFGRPQQSGSGNALEPFFASLGVRQILLWTDHPHWATNRASLEPPICASLAHPSILHILKSEPAAEEMRAIAGWQSVTALTMGEDYEALTPAPNIAPTHDVVLIQSDAAEPPKALHPFLDESDPDPAAMMEQMRDQALGVAERELRAMEANADIHASAMNLARALLTLRAADPIAAWWRLAQPILDEHQPSATWLMADIRRWVRFTAALHAVVAWRRTFWPAWLAQQKNITLSTRGAGDDWIDYLQQPQVYATGRVALNINAGHDEEGLTHKPFQIAAAGAACVHHDTRGLSQAFELDAEIRAFTCGSELLENVRALVGNPALRARMGEAMRARAVREHRWEDFLVRAIGVVEGAS